MDGRTRAFIAVDIDPEVRKGLAELVTKMECDAVRPVRVDQIHITLLFLGELEETKIRAMSDAVSRVDEPPFNILMNGIGTFRGGDLRIIYAKIIDGAEELTRIHSMLKESSDGLGIKTDEREFPPHATIARVNNPSSSDVSYLQGFLASHSEDTLGDFTCNQIKLKGSVLGEKGPTYSDIYVRQLPL